MSERTYQFDSTTNGLNAVASMEQEISEYETIIQEAKQQIASLKEDARTLAEKLILQAKYDNEQAMVELAAHMYWFHDASIPAGTICWILKAAPQNITNFIPPASYPVTCRDCGKSWNTIVRSRTALRAIIKDPCEICDECREASHARGREMSAKYQQEREEALERLRTMPYAEYLKTDHWQDLRTRMLKRAGYRCQVCNKSNVSLHVHHRTYKNRGCENYSDLIVLCAGCHEQFHENMELSK